MSISNAVKYLIDGFRYIVNELIEVYKKAKNARQYYGVQDHHIVAQNDWRAFLGRVILALVDIPINSQLNRVYISTTLHKHIHTTAYHAGVSTFVNYCYAKGRSYKDRVYYVTIGLQMLKTLIIAYDCLF